MENVTTIIGSLSSLGVKAANPVCAGLHIPYIAALATDPTLTLEEFPYVARVCIILDNRKCLTLACNSAFSFHSQ